MDSRQDVCLFSRKRMELTGIGEVESFSETEITLLSSLGRITVEGEGMKIERFSTEKGELVINGAISSFAYWSEDAGGEKRGLFARTGGVIDKTDFVILVRTGVNIGGKDADLFDRLRLTQIVDQTGRFPLHRRTAAEPQSADFPVNQEIVPADFFVDGHLGAGKGDQVLKDVFVDPLLNIGH